MEPGGVPVVFETCHTLVVLDRCSSVGPVVDLPKRERGWRQDGSGAWERSLQLSMLQKYTMQVYKQRVYDMFLFR